MNKILNKIVNISLLGCLLFSVAAFAETTETTETTEEKAAREAAATNTGPGVADHGEQGSVDCPAGSNDPSRTKATINPTTGEPVADPAAIGK